MTRRVRTWGWKVRGLVFAGAAILAGSASGTETSGPQAWPLFVMDPAVRRMAGTVEEKLDTIRTLGYAGVSSNDPGVEGIRRVIREAETREMRVHALYLAAPLTTGGLQLPERFDEICEAAAGHGTLIWFYTPGKAYRPSDQSADAVAVPALRSAAERAARHGVRLALYHHRDNWIETFADALRVADKVDRPNLGVSFNLCHALSAGEEEKIPELLRQAGGRLFMVTLNGADKGAAGAGWDRLIRPLGEGSYDLRPLLKLLWELGYREAIGFQSFGIRTEPVECLRRSMEGWRALEAGKRD